MSRKRKVLIAANIATLLSALAFFAYVYVEDILVQEESRRIVEQCTSEVKKGCPLLYNYVSELEKQNAYLMQRVSECNVSSRPTTQPSPDSGR